jgi:uncharacterized protein DUF3330
MGPDEVRALAWASRVSCDIRFSYPPSLFLTSRCNMTTPDKPFEATTVVCDVCLKEIPASEAKNEEALDYVVHFCGLDCYTTWKQRIKPVPDNAEHVAEAPIT